MPEPTTCMEKAAARFSSLSLVDFTYRSTVVLENTLCGQRLCMVVPGASGQQTDAASGPTVLASQISDIVYQKQQHAGVKARLKSSWFFLLNQAGTSTCTCRTEPDQLKIKPASSPTMF
jgi:hypothetical protein